MSSKKIVFISSTITRILGGTAVLLVIASFKGQLMVHFTGHPTVFGFVPLFNLNEEANFPTFFSTFLLLIAAGFLAVVACLEINRENSWFSHWKILSILFFMMAIDEYVSLHERMGEPIKSLLGADYSGIFYYPWVIPGMLIVLIFGLYFLKFWSSLPQKTKLTFFIAASIYIAGCIGMELVSGSYVSVNGVDTLMYSILTTIEESLEMAGIILFIWGLMNYINDNFGEITFRLNPGKDGE
jgi:hypothetical protein